MKLKHYIVFLFFLSNVIIGYSQAGMYSYGVQVKPIIPVKYFNETSSIIDSLNYRTTTNSGFGHSFGMVVRRGITNTIALEYGINHNRRNFKTSLDSVGGNEIDYSKFGYVSYEIPFQVLLYVKLFDNIYMNGAGGCSFNFFASSVEKDGVNDIIKNFAARTRWADLALISNIGFEYRTPKKGTFYLGASYHLPFHYIADSRIDFRVNSYQRHYHSLRGTYFTVDLRYFFKELAKPLEKTEKKKKKKK